MRFLHTSDWHLGRSFLGVSLVEDQAVVLDQLVDAIARSGIDAVLLAGDVYDRASPPADAVRLLDDTLTRIVVGLGVPVVMIAGNHDSGDRLAFGSRLLGARGLHVAGTEPLVVPMGDAHGRVDVVAVPFAEPMEVAARRPGENVADHEAGLRADLAGALLAASSPAGPATPAPASGASLAVSAGATSPRRVAVSHAFVAGGSTSESERPLVAGNAALVSAACFDGFAYAALGHLHRPQSVGRAAVRYSGSLLKYSFDEASHRKSVSIVELGADGACAIEELTLSPRRDVRVLEGSLDELRRAGEDDPGRDDYVLAVLSDRGAVLDPMGKLRVQWPNCLRVDRSAFFAERDEAAGARADLRRLSEPELFAAFFRDVTGTDLVADEEAAFADALAAVRRAQAEA